MHVYATASEISIWITKLLALQAILDTMSNAPDKLPLRHVCFACCKTHQHANLAASWCVAHMWTPSVYMLSKKNAVSVHITLILSVLFLNQFCLKQSSNLISEQIKRRVPLLCFIALGLEAMQQHVQN